MRHTDPSFAARLKKWRASTGITQATAAEKCCAAEDHYRKWEVYGQGPAEVTRKLLDRYVLKTKKETWK